MWIWWIISLIVLIACFIFAYRVIMSSYDFLPADKRNFLKLKRNFSVENSPARSTEAMWDIKNQLQKVEEISSFYEIQFSKLQQRLKALEFQYENQQQQVVPVKKEEEDWKEMYYEENELKEKLENELDITRQKLEEVENKLRSLEENNTKLSGLQSEYDSRLNDLQSMQNNIGFLQRKLEAATLREKELEVSLMAEINEKKQYVQLESQLACFKSENDDLRQQIIEVNKKEKALEGGIARLNELEATLAVYEEEKAKMIADLELMVNQNKMFSTPRNI